MDITFDPKKREWTLAERGLDFAEAEEVFAGETADSVDDRHDYGEIRMITAGFLPQRPHVDRRLDTSWRPPPCVLDEESQ